ncbi:hypothetical protein COCCADRAFT_97058, partial [Bipolaris zeicola 26-R-13]
RLSPTTRLNLPFHLFRSSTPSLAYASDLSRVLHVAKLQHHAWSHSFAVSVLSPLMLERSYRSACSIATAHGATAAQCWQCLLPDSL